MQMCSVCLAGYATVHKLLCNETQQQWT